MTTHLTEPQTGLPPDFGAAARTEAACKVYGTEQTEVRALDGVTVDFARETLHGDHGPVRLGEVDPAALHRRAGHADLRPRPTSATPT